MRGKEENEESSRLSPWGVLHAVSLSLTPTTGRTSYMIYKTQDKIKMGLLVQKLRLFGDFPFSPVVKNLRFQCKEQGFNPWIGN